MQEYHVYIMTSRNRTLYIGVTNDISRRVFEHKQELTGGFTKKYKVSSLVFFETTSDVEVAIAREKPLKSWRRSKNVGSIESTNPGWNALSLAGMGEVQRKRPLAEFILSVVEGLGVTYRKVPLMQSPLRAT